jgi:hypothetical protein
MSFTLVVYDNLTYLVKNMDKRSSLFQIRIWRKNIEREREREREERIIWLKFYF